MNDIPHGLELVWDVSLRDAFALAKSLEHAGQFAQSLTGHITPDGHGARHRLHSAVAFQAKYGQAAVVIANPGDHQDDDTAGRIANRKVQQDRFNLQQRMDGVLIRAVEMHWPKRIRAMIEVNHSLDHLFLHEQYSRLKVLLPITADDIDVLKADIIKPWKRDVKIETATAHQLECLANLEAIGQHPAPLEAIKLMWSAYTSTAQDRADFVSCMLRFRDQRPLLADQTPAHFAASIVVYVNNIMPAEREANATRKQANAAEEVAAPVAAAAVVAPVAAAAAVAPQYQQQHQPAGRGAQQGRGAQHGRGGRGGRGGGRGGRGPAPAGQPRAYCHTHGAPAPGERGHHSNACWNPGANHNWDATFVNQLGGLAAV